MQLTQILALGGSLLAGTSYAKLVSIDVGENGLVMAPNSATADVGDTVQFTFYSPGHTVVQATFDKPCEPSSGGFSSGSAMVTKTSNKVFEINITSTDPIWYYCDVANHCPSGMVGVINAPSGKTVDDFANAAKNAQVVKPSSNDPQGGSLVAPDSGSGSSSGSPSATGAASSGSSAAATKTGGSSAGGSSASATAQASSTSSAAAAAVTDHAGLILPVIFAAAGLVL
ncbi:hypothetical protein FGG08_001464 [Glutinoglossum americanum]|uniref:Phytocyanin domain-containing protein n=1 Tax=Glutinoglossum americanum TaxID=1670608 RepID=A0A9P8L691_9PEZI|nr:hypothetical protein FGG08_001464 [Glutinoglossum americanum]